MKKKIIYFLLIITFLPLSVKANLEVEYPELPIFGWQITEDSSLPEYIQYLFGLGMIIAGFLALSFFVFGGIKYLISLGNPQKISEAKSTMIGAILGLILLLGSYIIIGAIDEDIRRIEVPELETIGAVYFSSHRNLEEAEHKRPAHNIADVNKMDDRYHYIVNDCPENSDRIYYPALFNIYEETRFKSPINTLVLECGQSIGIGSAPGSFTITEQKPGVYLYLRNSGPTAYRIYTTKSIDRMLDLSPATPLNIHAIEIINDSYYHQDYNGNRFGVMAYGNPDFKGICNPESGLIFSKEEDRFKENTQNLMTSSLFVFRWQPDKGAGEYVRFYSRPHKGGGSYLIESEQIHTDQGYKNLDIEDITFSGLPSVQRGVCNNFDDCSGSIEIGGSHILSEKWTTGEYLVVVFGEREDVANVNYCQTFQTTIPNLKETWIGKSHGSFFSRYKYTLTEVKIIPIK